MEYMIAAFLFALAVLFVVWEKLDEPLWMSVALFPTAFAFAVFFTVWFGFVLLHGYK